MNRISSLFNFIANKIGNTAMGTTAITITGAIAEHEGDITSIENNPAIKWYQFSSGSHSFPSGASTITINVPATPTGYTTWLVGARATSRYVTFTWTYSSGTITVNAYNSNSSAVTCYINGIVGYFSNSCKLTL